MLQFSRVIQAVDSHTAGEPTRVVTGGLPLVLGATMADKRAELQRAHDELRRALVLEPRGHDAIVLALLLPPCAPGAHLGVVFANDAGYLGMCGHGAIGVATVAVATGMVAAVEPVTEVVLDTPAGVVACRVAIEQGRVRSVAITNVPSFLFRQRVVVPVHGFGKVAADIAYGGNWFAFVEADQLGLSVGKSHLPVLMQAATAVREALVREGVRGRHPDRGVDEIVDHVKLFEPLDGEAPARRRSSRCCTRRASSRPASGSRRRACCARGSARGCCTRSRSGRSTRSCRRSRARRGSPASRRS
jgi:proline racemase